MTRAREWWSVDPALSCKTSFPPMAFRKWEGGRGSSLPPEGASTLIIPTKGGNHIRVFYNPKVNVLALSLHGTDKDYEFVRVSIDEKKLLKE